MLPPVGLVLIYIYQLYIARLPFNSLVATEESLCKSGRYDSPYAILLLYTTILVPLITE